MTLPNQTQPDADETASWVLQAACRGLVSSGESDPWFPVAATSTEAYAEAREVCAKCPVAAECLDRAMQDEAGRSDRARWGMWGGKTPMERKRIDKATRERRNQN